MRTYEAVDAALIRGTTIPEDLKLPPWPDLTGSDVPGWREWLGQVWALDGFADAVRVASADLATQVERQLRGPDQAAAPSAVRRLRRLVETVARYLLRWRSRATPFGLFAGAAPVKFGTRAVARWGGEHQVVTRPDELFLDEQAERIEQRLDILRTVPVVTNCLGFARGRSWVVPAVSVENHLWNVEVGLTRPVRLAVEAARRPITFSDLTARLAAEAPAVDLPLIERMLADLVARRVLLSAVRPPMTVTDPAAHLARYTALPDPDGRSSADVRVDCSVTLPTAVLREAEHAASILPLVAPEMPGWRAYHQAFLERYGPDAAVPVRYLVGGSGLGFPAGYRGSHRREPQLLTPRDVMLAKIAQRAALDGRDVVLDDDLIARLRVGNRPPVPHTEMRFSLTAQTLEDLERGAFTLTVISGARHAGVTVGRLLHLFDDAERERFRRAYRALPTAMPKAITAQISGPPQAPKMTAVTRAPEILPVLPLGEYFDNPGIDLHDLAVTADPRRLWLVSQSQGCPVEPMLFNAVDLPDGQQPLARFLTEIWMASTAPCCPFTWGALARELPYLPRVRRGRSILHPAQWTITAAALPTRATSFRNWRVAWERLRDTYRIPPEVLLGGDDVRIRLDLGEPAHLALLRGQLDRQPQVVLTETGGRPGWIGDRPHELVLTLARTSAPTKPQHARQVRAASTAEHRPGLSHWLYTQVYGLCDEILSRITELLDNENGWWFIRYREPEPHLRLRIPLPSPAQFGPALQRLGQWADRLRTDGLLRDYTIHTYRPEIRFGSGPTLAAAEAVFAADSHAALQRLSGDRTITTAAGLIAIADAFTAGNGPDWLIEHVAHKAGPSPTPSRPVSSSRDQVARIAGLLEDGRLARALTDYRAHIDRDGLDPDRVLADLLHLHHARMIGVDLNSERYCLRLARATAQSQLARGAS